MTELAERYGISRTTAFKWVERYAEDRILMTVPKLDDLESDAANPEYDVMPDGERFIFNLGSSASAATHYNVVLNWFLELKNRASR